MPRSRTASFVAEFPLRTTPADERALAVRLDAARQVYNAALGEALRRLALMRESREWQAARAMPKSLGKDAKGKPVPNRARTDAFKAAIVRFGFIAAAIQKHAEACRDACWIGDHLGSHDTQTSSLRAFRAVQMHAFGKRGRPRFKGFGRLHSVEGKGDAVLRLRSDPVLAVHWAGLVLPLLLDPRDPRDRRGWQAQALACRTKYVRVLRRTIRGRVRWYAQLVQEGEAPRLHATREGVVGLDLGPSTVAVVASDAAALLPLCPSVAQPWAEARRQARAMDRSRRATNPDNFDAKGRVKPGRKRWLRSERYKRVQRRRAETERRLAAERKRAHGELANRILARGTTIKTEALSYRAFQKSFGRSVKVRAPGLLIQTIRRKAAGAGGGMVEINTRRTRLSQFDHTTGEYVKKPLSQRWHVFGDGVSEPVQRDLYSAFLATCCGPDSLDARQVHAVWPGAEPLLRRAASGLAQPASGWGSALPHVREGVGAGRPSKGDGRPGEAADAVARARAAESLGTGTPRTPRL